MRISISLCPDETGGPHPLHAHAGATSFFSSSHFENMLTEGRDFGLQHLVFLGPEPSSHPDFHAMVALAARMGLTMAMHSSLRSPEAYVNACQLFPRAVTDFVIELPDEGETPTLEGCLVAAGGIRRLGPRVTAFLSLKRSVLPSLKALMAELASAFDSIWVGASPEEDWSEEERRAAADLVEICHRSLPGSPELRLHPSLQGHGGVPFCPALDGRNWHLDGQGRGQFCRSAIENHGILGRVEDGLENLLIRREAVAHRLRSRRVAALANFDDLSELNSCSFCRCVLASPED